MLETRMSPGPLQPVKGKDGRIPIPDALKEFSDKGRYLLSPLIPAVFFVAISESILRKPVYGMACIVVCA